ncbi:MAG: RHS repeat-associated core domain-containing protein [Deltaproteobacteria bacterium]|nr:RHS repeat-associated core domain-containing protein [Deltaproteobacteria bacterium]
MFFLEVLDKTQNGTTTTTTTSYVHGPGIDEPLSLSRDGQTYYYHADGLGSITSITDANQAAVNRYAYDSFGALKKSETIRNAYTYTGREYDIETGLYFYRARYYDPEAGRFVSKDPIGFAGGDVNVYGYVGNNPANWMDPLGLSPIGAIKKVLKKVYGEIGGRLPKNEPGLHGAPQRGDAIKGYRLDQPHPGRPVGDPESYPHINWWDYSEGKRKAGRGRKGVEPIIEAVVGFIGGLLDPFDSIAGELDSDEEMLRHYYNEKSCKKK